MLVVLFVATLIPASVFAGVVFEENYATSSTTDLSGWTVDTQPTHAVLEKTSSGIQIRQTKHTYYAADGSSKNTTTDGRYKKELAATIASDPSKGMQVSLGSLKGKVKLTMDYIIDQGSESDYKKIGSFVYKKGNGNGYYNLIIDGYIYLRLSNEKVAVSNASSIGNSTMSVTELTTSNGAGKAKKLVVEIDTEADTVSVSLDGGTKTTGPASNIVAGKNSKGKVEFLSITNMQRMNEGAYIKFTSLKVEKDGEDSALDSETLAKVEGFKNINVTDANNVSNDVSLPSHINGLIWKTSDASVMTKAGKISRAYESDKTAVTLSTSFEGKTVSGEAVTIYVKYDFNVTGLTSRNENTTIINPVPGATSTTEKYYTMPQRGNEEDGYPMPDDPDYITDSAFFGVWDASTSKWTSQPYFRYSEYLAMSKVEAAAKAGDYETAKTELLAYYRSIATTRISSVTSMSAANDKAYKAVYELLSRNAYVTNFISNFVIDTFKVSQNWADVEIDVKDRLNEAKGSYDIFTLVVASVDKYRNQAEVYSKESNYAPYIEATVNGVKKTFPVAKDATLQGGQYGDTNFGSNTVLYAEEAGSWAAPEDRTKRMFIGFDLSGLKRNDTISDAKIVLKARHTGTDAEKLMAAYWIGESSWLENKVCWNTFADHMYFSCNDMNCWDYVTPNGTAIKGKVCGYHRDVEPALVANLYSYYSQHPDKEPYYEKYAYTYLRQYMGLINSIGLEPTVMNQLDMSTHITGVSQDVLRLIDSKYMTGEILTAYLKHLWLLTDYHIYNYYGKTVNNFATFSTGAVYNMTARFPEFERHDVWREITLGENNRVFAGFTFEDGMCYELSHNYHTTLLSTFATPFATNKKTGEPLPFSDEATEVIHNIVTSLMNQSGPYFGGFNMGDGYDPYKSMTSTYKTWYNNLFKDDPAIEYRATDGASGEMPARATTNYPVGQRTFMRTDWSQNALALGMTNKLEGSHGHNDALSIAMFAYGKYLLTDQGYGSVQTGNTMYYMKSPQQHNLVTVNDSRDYIVGGYVISDVRAESFDTVTKKDGEQMAFDSNKLFDFVEYKTDAYTTTQNSQRSVTFLKNQKFWIVTDYHIPTDTSVTNEFAQNWHLYPGAKMTIDSDTKVIESHFVNEPNVMVVPVDPSTIDKTEIRGTWYSENGGQIVDSQKGMLYRSKKGNGVFSTIIMPMDVGEDYTITTNKLTNSLSDENINLFSFNVKNEVTNKESKFYYYHVNEASMQTTVSVGEYSTDANTLVVEEDMSGNVVSLYMVDGSFVKKGADTIIATVDGKKANAGFDVENKMLEFHSSAYDIKDIENFKINKNVASYVKFEKTTYIPYTVVDNMMTFADVQEGGGGLHDSPKSGRVIMDSAVNPELVEVVTNTQNGWYKITNNFATGGGIKFENVKADSAVSGINRVAILRLHGILDEDEENGTTTVTNLMTGKYAIEMTLQQNITTERATATYAAIYFTYGAEDANGNITDVAKTNSIDLRLYNDRINAVRNANTLSTGVRKDANKLAKQTLAANKEWKLRIAIDTVNQTYTAYVNDVPADEATEFPLSILTNYNFLPDISINLMKASSVGAYVQINNIKVYEIERDETDEYVKAQNNLLALLPAKLTEGNVDAVMGSVTVPAISNVMWKVSDNPYLDLSGKLIGKITQRTPVTYTATSLTSAPITLPQLTKTFKLQKLYNMTLVSDFWELKATKSGNTVSVDVEAMTGNYSANPVLVFASYDADGKVCELKVKTVTEKLTGYNQTVKGGEKVKVFLLNNIKDAVPLAQNIELR